MEQLLFFGRNFNQTAIRRDGMIRLNVTAALSVRPAADALGPAADT